MLGQSRSETGASQGGDFTQLSQEPYPPSGSAGAGRISRVGLGVLVFGVLLIAGGVFFESIDAYEIVNGGTPFFGTFRGFELTALVESFLFGLGLVVATIGWILDRSALDSACHGSVSNGFRTRTRVGLALVGVGALMIATVPFIDTIVAWSEYQSAPLTWLTENDLIGAEVTAGLGVIVLLIGWATHHLAILRLTERPFA